MHVEIQLANKLATDLSITAVLSDTVMRSIYGMVWPDESKNKSWYAGYHRTVGEYQKPPRHEEAALLLLEGKPQTLVAPNAGYNFGLVGVAQELTIKAGQSLMLPVLFIAIERPESDPDVKLSAILEELRPQLLHKDR